MELLYLIPRQGLRVLHPNTGQPLPPEGMEVEKSTYWLRRISSGEVVKATSVGGKKPSNSKPKIQEG